MGVRLLAAAAVGFGVALGVFAFTQRPALATVCGWITWGGIVALVEWGRADGPGGAARG